MKIICMTDSPNIKTGMARVGREIALGLCEAGHEVVYIGWYRDAPDTQKWPFKLIPSENKHYGEDVFDRTIVAERPDYVLTIGDPWMYSYIADKRKCRTRDLFQWIGYVAVDGHTVNGTLPVFWDKVINDMDRVVAYTNYGKNVLLKSFPNIVDRLSMIYHGVKTDTYYPLPEQSIEKVREQFIVKDKFVFLIVARNQGRKNWSEVFKAWKIIQDDNLCPNAVLWPHTYFYDRSGYNMDDIIDTFGLDKTKSIVFFDTIARSENPMSMVPDKVLNQLYNASDCLISLGGEGFGLPIIENMACRKPSILIDHSAPAELGANGRALLVKVKNYATGLYLTERPMPDVDDIVDKCVTIYKDAELRRDMSKNAYEFATQYDWKDIGIQWDEYFKDLTYPTKKPLILAEVS